MISIDLWIVEDDAMYRRTLQRMLESAEHIICSRVFPSFTDLLDAVKSEKHPDLLLSDLGLPDMDGVEGIRRLAEVAPDITVLVLTVFKEKEKVMQALEAGAAGYLLKNASVPEILGGIEQVFMGQSALSPAVAKIVLGELQKPSPAERFDLTGREIEVLENLAKDLSVKEIAAELSISRGTVAFHLGNIYQKLHVQSQSGAVAKALRSGII